MVKKKSQASLELAFGIVVVFVLLFGSLQVFFWMNKRLMQRQQDYEANRATAANSPDEIQVDESDTTKYPPLKILK